MEEQKAAACAAFSWTRLRRARVHRGYDGTRLTPVYNTLNSAEFHSNLINRGWP